MRNKRESSGYRCLACLLFALMGMSVTPAVGLGYEPGDVPIPHPEAPLIERVTIPAGEFSMGTSNGADPDRGPAHRVYLDTYQIGKFEVTWEQYQVFVDAGGYQDTATNGYWSRWGAELSQARLWKIDEQWGNRLEAPQWTRAGAGPPGFTREGRWPPRPTDPVVGISPSEAEAFCRFVGGRAPTEAEWEKAASWGPDATEPTLYSWGNDATTPIPANGFVVAEGGSRIQAVDNPVYEGDVTRYGVRGMGGNVSEWVADMYDPEYYAQGPGSDIVWRNPFNFLAKRFDYEDAVRPHMPLGWVIRGANFMNVTDTPEYFDCARRQSESHLYRNGTIGFRVAWDVTPPQPPAPVERTDRPGAAVSIPGGDYLIGHSDGMPGTAYAAHPQHSVCLNGYWIGEYEVTWYEYRKFMELGGYGDPLGPKPDWWSEEGWKWRTLPPCAGGDIAFAVEQGMTIEQPAHAESDRPQFPQYRTVWKGPWNEKDGMGSPPDDHPVFGLSWYEAEAFCRFVGGRLPLEAEWEVAASWNPDTGKPMQFPWGNHYTHPYDMALANSGDDPKYGGLQSSPVGMYPEGRSPFGCFDMSGNAIEWCRDWARYDSYTYHSSECGTRPTIPDSLMVPWPSSCDPDYWPRIGIKAIRGGSFDAGYFNSPTQGARWRESGSGDGLMIFRNYTYGFRVAWDRDPSGREEAERTRPPYKSGTDTPSPSKGGRTKKRMGNASSIDAIPAVLKSDPITVTGAIDTPGKEDWYRVAGPSGVLVTLDLDAGAGADDLNGTSPLDAVIEIWHEGIPVPVKVRDDELVPKPPPSGDRWSYFDPPILQHRMPEEGYFLVKVRAYSWPAEGSQSGLSEGERSNYGPDYTYALAITAPEVTETDPSGDGMLTAQDLLEVLEGFKTVSSKRVQSDLTGDGTLDFRDLFQTNRMWLRLGQKTGKSIANR